MYNLGILFLALLILYAVLESSGSSYALDPTLLCKSRCLAKCYMEHNSTSNNQCGHCMLYDANWLQHTCTTVNCLQTCDDLVGNHDGQVPSKPLLMMSEENGKLSFTWQHHGPYMIYLLQHRGKSFPWTILEQTTTKHFELTHLVSPPCINVTNQLRVIAVNQYGAGPTSKVIHLDNFTTAKNLKYIDGATDGDDVNVNFNWTNIPGWSDVVGRYQLVISDYNGCNVMMLGGFVGYSTRSANQIQIALPKSVVIKNCQLQFKLLNDRLHYCYSVSPLTVEVLFDCDDFDICISEPLRTLRVTGVSVAPYQNQSAFVSWTNPHEITNQYEILIRWGEVEMVLETPYIIEENASITSVPWDTAEVLLADLESGFTYGVQVAVHVKGTEKPRFNIMFTITFEMPIDPPTDLHTTADPIPLVIVAVTATTQTLPKTLPNSSIIVAVVGCLVITALATVFCVCYFKYHREEENKDAIASQVDASVSNIYSSSPNPQVTTQNRSRPLLHDRWEIPHSHIHTGETLGEGAFGKVIRGKIEGRILTHHNSDSSIVSESMKSCDVDVAVKMLHGYAEDSEKQEFLREIQLMKNLGYHTNVVSLIACCTRQDPICLVVEHCSNGDLLNFLRSRRPHYYQGGYSEQPKENLKAIQLLSFARQIVMGMEYLAQKGFVHRDLAARNVLVMGDKTMKIGDFGLTRFVYDDKVYVHKNGGRLPIKWMSIESVYDQVFTSQSDVWSFGILFFEIITLGSAPYPGISNHEIPKLLKRGYRMEAPEGCSKELYAIMKSCWRILQDDRPTFTNLRHQLENILEQDTPYLDLDACVDRAVEQEEDSSQSGFNIVQEEEMYVDNRTDEVHETMPMLIVQD